MSSSWFTLTFSNGVRRSDSDRALSSGSSCGKIDFLFSFCFVFFWFAFHNGTYTETEVHEALDVLIHLGENWSIGWVASETRNKGLWIEGVLLGEGVGHVTGQQPDGNHTDTCG